MGDYTESVSIGLTPQQKSDLRAAAAEADMSMAEFARRETLSAVEVTDDNSRSADESATPLEDFITAELRSDEDATPVAKRRVYEWYEQFCAEHYPDHEVESQHKVSREVKSRIAGVDTGRRYGHKAICSEKTERARCFLNLKRVETPSVGWD